ncbi:hypothetical protein [Roseovarius pacificus]|uniref:hypothetical protein n=1 Tax=Roseovarius pacificus TaxID=337701 RepID=UPI002A18CE95|nr:hypothetical protein [Roseovarius pacificus]
MVLSAAAGANFYLAILVILGQAATTVADDATVAQLKADVIAWAESVQSFDGAYTLVQYPGVDTASSEAPLRKMLVQYRFQDDNRFMRIVDEALRSDDAQPVLTLARYKGVVSQRADDDRGDRQDPLSGHVNGSEWPLPDGAFLTPNELFGTANEVTLAEVLTDGETLLFREDGFRVLSHRTPDSMDVDIWLAQNGDVIRLDWVVRLWPTYSDAQIAEAIAGDPFYARHVITTLDLSAYKTIDGVRFPTFARKSWWNVVRNDEAGAGKPAPDDAIARFAGVTQYERAAQTFDMRPEDARINVPLAADDFDIRFTEGMLMRDWSTQEEYRYSKPWYERRIAYLAIVPAIIAAFLVLLLMALMHKRRRKRFHV